MYPLMHSLDTSHFAGASLGNTCRARTAAIEARAVDSKNLSLTFDLLM
jgi:hypothetical protein